MIPFAYIDFEQVVIDAPQAQRAMQVWRVASGESKARYADTLEGRIEDLERQLGEHEDKLGHFDDAESEFRSAVHDLQDGNGFDPDDYVKASDLDYEIGRWVEQESYLVDKDAVEEMVREMVGNATVRIEID